MLDALLGKVLGWIPSPWSGVRLQHVVAARLCSLVHPTYFSYDHPLPRGELHIDFALELWSKEKPTTVRAVVAEAAGQSLVSNWTAVQLEGNGVPVLRDPELLRAPKGEVLKAQAGDELRLRLELTRGRSRTLKVNIEPELPDSALVAQPDAQPLWGPGRDPVTLNDHDLRAEADRLSKELKRFREQQAKALPPLEGVVVPGDPERLEGFKEWREQDAIETYQASFQERVGAVYEELVRRRGYGHPMMDGRWNDIQKSGEIDTVARALEDMANPEPEGPPPRLRDDDGRRIQVLVTRDAIPDTNIDPEDTTMSGWRAGSREAYGWQVVRGEVILRPPVGTFASSRR